MKNTSKFSFIYFLIIAFGLANYLFISRSAGAFDLQLYMMIFWTGLSVISINLMGMPKEKIQFKSYAMKTEFVFIALAIIVAFLLGLFTGFSYNAFSFNWDFTIKYSIMIFVCTFCKEIVRFVFAKKSIKNKKPLIILTIIFISFILVTNRPAYGNFEELFIYICTMFLPLMANELLASYLSYNFGLSSAVIYMIPMSLYNYVLPILPNLGDFIMSALLLLVPFLIYFSTVKIVRYNNKEIAYKSRKLKSVLLIPILVFLIVIIVLVSGIFKYKLIAIGSNSMVPVFHKGDAIIYKQMKNEKDVKKGDILVFQKNNIIVTHRVVAINYKNNKMLIKTKGDANDAYDGYYVYEEDILGVATNVVKYIGYPTVWITETFKGV